MLKQRVISFRILPTLFKVCFVRRSLLSVLCLLLSIYGMAQASTKQTYTWYLNKPVNALNTFKNLRDVNPAVDFTSAYLTPANQPLAPAMHYVWTRAEDKNNQTKISRDYTLIFRARATLAAIPDVIDGPDRVRFSYWQYIRRFVFFGGSAQGGTVLAPDPQWINEAHQHSVAIYGTVFLAPVEFGGAPEDCATLATFDSLKKLADIAKKLKFDGWFLNVESVTGDQRVRCMNSIDRVLESTDIVATGVKFIKYVPGTGSPKETWVNDDSIANVTGVYGIEAHNNGGHVYLNDWAVNNVDLLRPFLMFVDEPYWANLQSNGYLLKPGEAVYAKAASDTFWYGDNGLAQTSLISDFPWNGMAALAKGFWGEVQEPGEARVPTGFIDRDFAGRSSPIVDGAVRQDTSSLSIDDRTWVQACLRFAPTVCAHYFDATAYVGDQINDRGNVIWHIKRVDKPVYPVPLRVYQDRNFEGDQREYYYATAAPLALKLDANGDFSKRITSLKLAPGWKATLCNASAAQTCQHFYDDTWQVPHQVDDSSMFLSLTPVAEPAVPPVRLFFSPRYAQEAWYPGAGTYTHPDLPLRGADQRVPAQARYGMSSAKIKAGWTVRACLNDQANTCQNYYADSPNFLADTPNYQVAGPIRFKTYSVSALAAGAPAMVGYRYKNQQGPQVAVYPNQTVALPAAVTTIGSLWVQPGYLARLCTSPGASSCIELTGYRPDLSAYRFSDLSPLYLSVRKLQ
ncbi:hypothetical protein ACVW0Y_002053 [Pseudomonas sp. TE3786]